jgi:hypothetical protein
VPHGNPDAPAPHCFSTGARSEDSWHSTRGTSSVAACAALLIGVAALGAMFINNSRYDGNSPVPVGEQRR